MAICTSVLAVVKEKATPPKKHSLSRKHFSWTCILLHSSAQLTYAHTNTCTYYPFFYEKVRNVSRKKIANIPSWWAAVRNKPTTREERTARGWLKRVLETWIARRKRERMVHSSCMCICVRGERTGLSKGSCCELAVHETLYVVCARWKRGNWSTGRSLSSSFMIRSEAGVKVQCSGERDSPPHSTYIRIYHWSYIVYKIWNIIPKSVKKMFSSNIITL